MAGKCGAVYRAADPRIDDAVCNALTRTSAGLLVPRTVVEGVAPGTAVGTGRSVDVDVQEPAAGDCPEMWQVGARLTPVWGQVSGQMALNGAYDEFGPIPGTAHTLPETGVYQLAADVQGGAILQGAISNYYIQAHIFDVTTGAVVPLTARTMFLYADPQASGLHTLHVTATCAAFYQAAAGTTVWVEAQKHVDTGVSSGDVVFCLNFRFIKIAD